MASAANAAAELGLELLAWSGSVYGLHAGSWHYSFRWYSDYSGGAIWDHGAHHHDIAQWIIGADGSGPTKVEGSGTFHPGGPHDVVATFNVKFTYGKHGGVELVLTTEKSPYGGQMEIYGTRGRISVSRRRILAKDPSILASDPEPHDYQARLLESYARHYGNWLDCIDLRQRPVCDVEIGHRSVTLSHLANIVIRLDRPLAWNPATEEFVDDAPANRLLSRPMRALGTYKTTDQAFALPASSFTSSITMATVNQLVEELGSNDPQQAFQAQQALRHSVDRATDPSKKHEREELAAILAAELIATVERKTPQATNVPGTDLGDREPKHARRSAGCSVNSSARSPRTMRFLRWPRRSKTWTSARQCAAF